MPEEFSTKEPIRPFGANNPLVRILAQKYERRGLHIWSNDRVNKLACDLNCTIHVLCARAGMFACRYDGKRDLMRLKLDTLAINKAIENNLWPVSATLHFELLEKEVAVKKGKGILFSTANEIDTKLLAGTLEKGMSYG